MINYASGGYGSSGHLAIELFKKFTHIELVHVPYKSGGLVATALLAGEVDVSFNTIPSLITYVKAGRLRTLGVSTPQRSLSLPEVPAIAEQGYPGFSASGLAGLLAPAGTPPDAIDRIQKEVAVLVKQPALIERFVALGLEPVGNTPAEFNKFIRSDLEKWTQLTRELKINLQ
jgi:tripartite-type tricarboxylate transporter receptor subunit TctC